MFEKLFSKKNKSRVETILSDVMEGKAERPLSATTILTSISQNQNSLALLDVYIHKTPTITLINSVEDVIKLVSNQEFVRQLLLGIIKREDCPKDVAERLASQAFSLNISPTESASVGDLTEKETTPENFGTSA